MLRAHRPSATDNCQAVPVPCQQFERLSQDKRANISETKQIIRDNLKAVSWYESLPDPGVSKTNPHYARSGSLMSELEKTTRGEKSPTHEMKKKSALVNSSCTDGHKSLSLAIMKAVPAWGSML
jgi:hypothetical protein